MSRYDVLVVGYYFADLIFSGLPGFPELGKEIVGTGFDMVTGGACNSAIAMHRLGLRVGWAADFGDDSFSQFALERTRAEGLDDALFVHHPRPLRNVTVAVSYPDDRAFITYRDKEPNAPAAFKALLRTSARAIFVAGFYYGPYFTVGRLVSRLKGMKLVMDGNSEGQEQLSDAAVRRAIRSSDLFLPNAPEAQRLTGSTDLDQATRVLAGLGPLVVVKAGARGAYACHRGEILHAPAIPVDPVDTTGAGDCFNAGFIRAWLDGKPLLECLRWGNIVGGLSTTARGGTGRMITLADVEKWLS